MVLDSLTEGMEIPEGAMLTGVIRVVSYINAEGEARVQWKFDGDQSVSQTVGDLERVQLSYLMQEGEFTDE